MKVDHVTAVTSPSARKKTSRGNGRFLKILFVPPFVTFAHCVDVSCAVFQAVLCIILKSFFLSNHESIVLIRILKKTCDANYMVKFDTECSTC